MVIYCLLSNNTVKISSKDRAIAGINEPKKPTDSPDLGIPLDEVEIISEGPKKPDVSDPIGPPSPDPNTVDSWPIEPINEAGGSNETGGNVSTPIIISLDDRLKYPSLAKLLDGLYDKVKNNSKLMEALKQFSHLSEAQILANLAAGKGPQIKVVDGLILSNTFADYKPDTGLIRIDASTVSNTNYFSSTYATAMDMFITAVVLHEFIHFGEHTTQTFVPHNGKQDDAGYQFENKYYGGQVDFNPITGAITYKPL